jgi:ATP/maltotriose-dependent transcriptional regulator MalT
MTSLLCDVQPAIDSQSLVSHLVDRSHDPVIQTGFLNAYAGLLAVAGQYEDALREAERQASIALEYSLDFVMPFAQLHAAAARWGLRSFQTCRANLASCERCTHNSRLLTHAAQLRARMCLATQRHDEAIESLDRVHHAAKASLPMLAEHLAWSSLAHALAGHQRDAVSLARRAEALSRRIEVSALVPWIKAVLASGKATARRSTGAAFDTAMATGNIDAFVTAYRAYPDLLQILAGDCSNHERLRIILERARDDGLAKQVGLPLSRTRVAAGESPLSSREREVMELLSQGLLNKEIARTLFIADGTVKAHVRSICRKLGARTRTEAVMRAAELSG